MAIKNQLPKDLAYAPDWAQDLYLALPHFVSYAEIAQVARMNRGSVANLCAAGRGPQGSRLTIGKKRVFSRRSVVLWFMSKSSPDTFKA